MATIWVHWASVYGPQYWAIPGVEFLFTPTLIAFGVFLTSGFLLLFRGSARTARQVVFGSASFILLSIISMHLADTIRRSGFTRLARAAAPRVSEIHAYTSRAGEPPQSLNVLSAEVRRDLPDFDYVSGPEAAEVFHGNPWALTLDTATGLINWDMFVYYPLQNYPRYGLGGSFEQIEDWVYVYE